jgi:hypothetical protein
MEEKEEITYVNYHFLFNDGSVEYFPIKLSLKDLSYIPETEIKYPSWTKLEFNQCQNCQLSADKNQYCPVALSLTDIIPKFKNYKSYEKVLVRVDTPERIYEKAAPLQMALGSLIGLIMPTSGCPTLQILRPMARFHLPFATIEETLYRSASCYLLGQYLKLKKSKDPDWDLKDLVEAYEEIQLVNMGITDRLRSISEEDANANAVVVLDVFAKALPSSILVELKELEYLYQEDKSPD